jgi:hypothetical protein
MGINSGARRQQKLAKEKEKLRKIAAEKEKRASIVPTIFLDESGNTGANLIDKEQPFFTMAGVNFSQGEAERLLALVDSKSPKEVHFSSLKRRRSGQEAVLRLLEHSLIKKGNVKVCVYHKQFMVTTKIVDLLIEYMANETGFDLYENGGNIALSNMLHYCMPTFCGEENVASMQKLFIEMIKKRDDEAINAFYESIEALEAKSVSEKFKGDLDMILMTKSLINDALSNVDRTNLDPLIPSLFSQCVEWGIEYPKGFHVIHDESKTLGMQQVLFEQFMDWTKTEMELGYDRRKFKLPLKGKSLNFATSEAYPQLQVADVVASAVSYWANGVYGGVKDDVFFQELDKLNFRKLITSVVWPSLDVTPQSLGTVHDGGINPADGSAYFLMKARANKLKTA